MDRIELRRAELGEEKILAYIQTESWKAAFSEILSPEELEKCTNLEKAEEMYRNVLNGHFVHLVIEYVEGKKLVISIEKYINHCLKRPGAFRSRWAS